jgi:hypothetical protein
VENAAVWYESLMIAIREAGSMLVGQNLAHSVKFIHSSMAKMKVGEGLRVGLVKEEQE